MSQISFEKWEHLAVEHRFCVERIARSIGVSTRTLNRAFRDAFGIGPNDWIEHLRNNRALTLLVSGRLTVKAISEALGFYSASAFCRAFRARHGLSPKEFREVFAVPKVQYLSVTAHPVLLAPGLPAPRSFQQVNRLTS